VIGTRSSRRNPRRDPVRGGRPAGRRLVEDSAAANVVLADQYEVVAAHRALGRRDCGKVELAMQLIFTPHILRLMEARRKA
jgi:phosphoribulokinase